MLDCYFSDTIILADEKGYKVKIIGTVDYVKMNPKERQSDENQGERKLF